MKLLIAWLLALAVHFAPPDRHEAIPTWNETAEQRTQRYSAIATDVAEVAMTSDPLPGLTRVQTAALLLSVAVGESGLQPDTDLGPCYTKGKYSWRCDGGRAVGIMQVQLPPEARAAHFADRKKLLRLGLYALRRSLRACRKLPPHLRLALYNSGTSCYSGREYSSRQWGYWLTFLQYKKPPNVPGN